MSARKRRRRSAKKDTRAQETEERGRAASSALPFAKLLGARPLIMHEVGIPDTAVFVVELVDPSDGSSIEMFAGLVHGVLIDRAWVEPERRAVYSFIRHTEKTTSNVILARTRGESEGPMAHAETTNEMVATLLQRTEGKPVVSYIVGLGEDESGEQYVVSKTTTKTEVAHLSLLYRA